MAPYTDIIIETIYKYLPSRQEDWILSGFISPDRNIYTFGNDSKIIGRLFEVLVTEPLANAAKQLGYVLGESEKQTVYPDFYFKKPNGKKIAIDVKTTYRRSNSTKFGFTGGSFTSFMRNGTKNIHGNYSDYDAHYILGIVYEREKHPTIGASNLENLDSIIPAYKNVKFFIQEKFRICGESKGSGNTDNIGTISSSSLYPFIYGVGPFSYLGYEVFHEYWVNYPKYKDKEEIKDSLYTNIEGYIEWVRKKDNRRADQLSVKYQEYLKSYKSMENNGWKFDI
ncbi:restriction endonuclease EcoRV [Pasteurella langaaensis DSM 22999]|uniref:Restriction endonuclease EcoRV n=1 Tax=Alitibacter langaaensis DSM 22999 TaxID=1122935 RepID=A0A2U0T8B6_9PAST|nr:type II restriction endonuclease [Pasteurella langaaensis]PVX39787.1 restriction endonuclease EcoRV [Pasteurella langaaensis DSM 22999]